MNFQSTFTVSVVSVLIVKYLCEEPIEEQGLNHDKQELQNRKGG